MSVDEVLAQVSQFGCGLVEVTGGEPLDQAGAFGLIEAICDAGFELLVETNGSLDVSPTDPRAVRIVDFKCPASGESGKIHWPNIEHLRTCDEAKFVIADRGDYEFAKRTVETHNLADRCTVILSPAGGMLEPADLAEWILQDRLSVRLGVQLHKMIWPDSDRGV